MDADLQWFAEQRIEQAVKQTRPSPARVVMMDVKSGELLAMAATTRRSTRTRPRRRRQDARGNPALEQVYEPGSVQKVVTMAALADAGLIDLNTKLTRARRIAGAAAGTITTTSTTAR